MRHIRVGAAIVRGGRGIRLVRQQTNGRDYWSLPGGVLEDGEPILAGLRREMVEETGLEVARFGDLAHVTELCTPEFISVAHVFEVAEWWPVASAPAADPAGEVVEVRDFPLPDAVSVLMSLPWPSMSEPISDHLAGIGRAFYSYATDESGDPARATRTAP